jgi:hypothetical protein
MKVKSALKIAGGFLAYATLIGLFVFFIKYVVRLVTFGNFAGRLSPVYLDPEGCNGLWTGYHRLAYMVTS